MKPLRKCFALFRKGKLDAEMTEQMRLHLERRAEESVSSGRSSEDARYATLWKFGGVRRTEEFVRDGRMLVRDEQATRVRLPLLSFWLGLTVALLTACHAPSSLRPRPDGAWTNTLGMTFVPVPRTTVLFCIWETRVQDFEAFVTATGYQAERGMYSFDAVAKTWKQKGDTWRSPGSPQSPAHPVCGVSWEDANAFCRWLTDKERKAGRLGADQEIRLPTDAEWSAAVGLPAEVGAMPQAKDRQVAGVYPWGTQWPPPPGAGNFAGEGDNLPWKIDGYSDGSPMRAKVGSYAANSFGIFDLAGNVWEWCADSYDGSDVHALRGGSWDDIETRFLLSSARNRGPSDYRSDYRGFRCVVSLSVTRP